MGSSPIVDESQHSLMAEHENFCNRLFLHIQKYDCMAKATVPSSANECRKARPVAAYSCNHLNSKDSADGKAESFMYVLIGVVAES
jgi:hypothetical protein